MDGRGLWLVWWWWHREKLRRVTPLRAPHPKKTQVTDRGPSLTWDLTLARSISSTLPLPLSKPSPVASRRINDRLSSQVSLSASQSITLVSSRTVIQLWDRVAMFLRGVQWYMCGSCSKYCVLGRGIAGRVFDCLHRFLSQVKVCSPGNVVREHVGWQQQEPRRCVGAF